MCVTESFGFQFSQHAFVSGLDATLDGMRREKFDVGQQ